MTQVQRASEVNVRSTASVNSRSDRGDNDFVTLLRGEASQQLPEKKKEIASAPNKKADQADSKEDTVQTKQEEKEPDTSELGLDYQQMLSQWLAFQNGFIESQNPTEKVEISNPFIEELSLNSGSSVPEEMTPAFTVEKDISGQAEDNAGFKEMTVFNTKAEISFPLEELGEQTEKTAAVKIESAGKESGESQNTEPFTSLGEKISGLKEERTEEDGRKNSDAEQSFTGSRFSERVAGENLVSAQQTSFKSEKFKTSFSEQFPADNIRMRTSEMSLGKDTAEAIASRMPLENGELNLELEPASLGKLTIKVAFEGGRAAVTVMSSNPKTLEVLSQNAGQMAQILEERTGQQTVVYTPQSTDAGTHPDQERSGYQEHRQERQEQKKESESFAQQLRLGLV